jgi:hypothetical protein
MVTTENELWDEIIGLVEKYHKSLDKAHDTGTKPELTPGDCLAEVQVTMDLWEANSMLQQSDIVRIEVMGEPVIGPHRHTLVTIRNRQGLLTDSEGVDETFMVCSCTEAKL